MLYSLALEQTSCQRLRFCGPIGGSDVLLLVMRDCSLRGSLCWTDFRRSEFETGECVSFLGRANPAFDPGVGSESNNSQLLECGNVYVGRRIQSRERSDRLALTILIRADHSFALITNV
jgi:hypothetical protein